MNKTLTFPDGGKLNAEYDGVGNGTITLTADINEGKDRTLTMKVMGTDGKTTASVSVSQEGKRENFVVSDTFSVTDGEFLVLKDGIQQ